MEMIEKEKPVDVRRAMGIYHQNSYEPFKEKTGYQNFKQIPAWSFAITQFIGTNSLFNLIQNKIGHFLRQMISSEIRASTTWHIPSFKTFCGTRTQ